MGRHEKVDSFYLWQSYTRIPKHSIRDNVNLLAVFRQDDMNLKHIDNDHVNTDMTYSIQVILHRSNMFSEEKSTLEQLEKARTAIKRKFNLLKRSKERV